MYLILFILLVFFTARMYDSSEADIFARNMNKECMERIAKHYGKEVSEVIIDGGFDVIYKEKWSELCVELKNIKLWKIENIWG